MLTWVIWYSTVCKVLSDTATTSVAISWDGHCYPYFIEEETEVPAMCLWKVVDQLCNADGLQLGASEIFIPM